MQPSLEKTVSNLFPKIPITDTELQNAVSGSDLGWKMGKELERPQLYEFFDHLRRDHLLYSLICDDEEFDATPFLKSFAGSLLRPFDGVKAISIGDLVGDEYVTYAYTGGYIFEDDDKNIQMYLAKDLGIKDIPFGDFHDVARGQFESEFRQKISDKTNPQRCLFFHTWNKNDNSIAYFVLPVETIFQERQNLRLGEEHKTEYWNLFSNLQIEDFENRYRLVSLEETKVILGDEAKLRDISSLLANDQLIRKIQQNLELRRDFGMDEMQALREAMRERILSGSGVKNAFSSSFSTEDEK